MSFVEQILHRRSVRQYTDESISEQQLQTILSAGLAAASSKNRQSWAFIVIRDKETLSRLCDCRPGAASLLAHCDTAIVVAADSEHVDVWVEDCASAITQMHLMADSLGIGSCWLQIRMRKTADGARDSQDVVREALQIPQQYSVMAILTLGMPVTHPGAKSIESLDWSKVHYEQF